MKNVDLMCDSEVLYEANMRGLIRKFVRLPNVGAATMLLTGNSAWVATTKIKNQHCIALYIPIYSTDEQMLILHSLHRISFGDNIRAIKKNRYERLRAWLADIYIRKRDESLRH